VKSKIGKWEQQILFDSWCLSGNQSYLNRSHNQYSLAFPDKRIMNVLKATILTISVFPMSILKVESDCQKNVPVSGRFFAATPYGRHPFFET
jgi:predicted neutral ceramidase superfamily lipid hydrolase